MNDPSAGSPTDTVFFIYSLEEGLAVSNLEISVHSACLPVHTVGMDCTSHMMVDGAQIVLCHALLRKLRAFLVPNPADCALFLVPFSRSRPSFAPVFVTFCKDLVPSERVFPAFDEQYQQTTLTRT